MTATKIDELVVTLSLDAAKFTAGVAAAKFALVDMVMQITDDNAAIGRFSRNMDIASEDVKAFGNIIEKFGGKAADAQAIMQLLALEPERLKLATAKLTPYLAQLGIQLSKPVTDIYGLADAFSHLDRQLAYTVGTEQMGFSSAAMTMMLDAGPEGLRRLRAEEEKNNLTHADSIKRAQALINANLDLIHAYKGVERELTYQLSPALEQLNKVATDVMRYVIEYGDAFSKVFEVAAVIMGGKLALVLVKTFGRVALLATSIVALFEDHKQAIEGKSSFFPKSWWDEFDKFFDLIAEFKEFVNMIRAINFRVGIDAIDRAIGIPEVVAKVDKENASKIGGTITPEYAFRFYKSKGLSDQDAAAIAMNMMSESGGWSGTSIVDTNGQLSKGLFQWQKDRANVNGKDVLELTPDEQLEHSWYEFTHGKSSALADLRNQKTEIGKYNSVASKYEVSTRRATDEMALANDMGNLIQSGNQTEINITNHISTTGNIDGQSIERHTWRSLTEQSTGALR
jgi:hypothetical protein